MVTVIQFSKQKAHRRSLPEDHLQRSCLPLMLALTPWWPVVRGLQFCSEVLAGIDCGSGDHAALLERSQKGDVAPAKVIPMAGLKVRLS